MDKNPHPTKAGDYVVLLHGIGQTHRIMRKMGKHLSRQGYSESLADRIHDRILQNCPDENRTIHFVGHSLGAIIIRLLIARHRPKRLGRVVMLAPPNQGSRLVDFLKRFPIFKWFYGPVGQALGTDEHSIVRRLPPVDYEVGIVAGDRSIDLLFSWFILSGKNDGKLTVEETKLDGMKDHIVLHATHPFMPSNPNVIKQTIYFLEHGKFFRESL